MKQYLQSLFNQLFLGRTLVLGIIYSILFVISLWLGYLLRFDFVIPVNFQAQLILCLPVFVFLKLLMLFVFGQFGVLLSYFRLPDLYRITLAMTLSSALVVEAWYLFPDAEIPPRSVLLADYLFSILFISGFRTSLRVVRERFQPNLKGLAKNKRVAIIGAGRTGADLAHDLLSRSASGLRPVVFIDDDQKKWHHQIHGIPVLGETTDLLRIRNRFGVKGVIIATSGLSARKILEITENAQSIGMSAEIVPSVTDLATGKVQSSRIRPVEIEDLLGRDPVDLKTEDIRSMIQGKVVMVTGAGGSIGSELSRQIFANNPKRLLLIERCEGLLYEIEMEIRRGGLSNGNLLPLVADISDESRMLEIFDRYRPEIIFHAAAHKHVPMMEHQPAEALNNNTFGTRRLAMMSKEFGVERFIFVSTDKAINPTNVMGASKRLAEIFIQSYNEENGSDTRFMAVRFGNVLGSSGSVVPLFRRQIASGGPVTVTHPEVIRYFMTIPEASGLVLQCATQGTGGEIFVLDMGEPIKILDLAHRMIQLSGYEPERDIEVNFIGLRPGEKLFEEIQHVGENYSATHHSRILRFTGTPYPLDEIEAFLAGIQPKLNKSDGDQLKREIQTFVPEYSPYLD